jgi:hypothetical protein
LRLASRCRAQGTVRQTFERIYALAGGLAPSPRVNPQEIALLFVILSQGTRYNIEMAFGDESAEDWLQLAELALVKGNFMSSNVISGIQTLHLMAHMHLLVLRHLPHRAKLILL